MENPATWKTAEVVILNAYAEWDRMQRAGAVGFSVAANIASALRREGLLKDADEPELGWEKLRELIKN
jgi:hypothetical protein